MPSAHYRLELNLPPEDDLFVIPRTTPMHLAAPTWTASYSTATPPRRHLTAADAPASPASSSASQKFEVKRLLSRPADLACSPRPLTTFDASMSLAGPSESPLSAATVKRSNSAGRNFLKRRPSKSQLDSPSAPVDLPRPRTATAPLQSYDIPPRPSVPPPAPSTLTPASAYALAYAQRTKMATHPMPAKRHPFESIGGGRVVALGDPTDDSMSLGYTPLALAGLPVEREKEPPAKQSLGLSRKVSARFGRRKMPDRTGAGAQSDAEVEDGRKQWNREKERAGVRAVGLALNPATSRQAKPAHVRMSRHLSIEDFSALRKGMQHVEEMGIKFEMETSLMEKDRGKRTVGTTVHDAKYGGLDRAVTREGPPSAIRSQSTPEAGYADSPTRPGTISSEKSGGGKLWRLVKKMSTGTLKEKRSSQPEKIPPVPRLPSTLPSSSRSSIIDYGEEVRPELSRFRTHSRPNTIHQSGRAASTHSVPASIHSGPPSLSGHHTYTQRSTGRPSLSSVYPVPIEYRPSMTNTHESSLLSSSPKSSFGRTQSPRTSMSSYVDIADDPPPPMPMAIGLVGKHIVAPGELAQYGVPGSVHQHLIPSHASSTVAQGSPSLPPPKRPRKPRDKPAPLLNPSSPPPPSISDSAKAKSKPNVLRRPTRLEGDAASGRLRSPRSASMGMPSPRSASMAQAPRARSQTRTDPPATRPRSSSMSTVFTFREIGDKKKLSEQEKVDKFEQLLEASDKAGGTLHARLQERLLSDTIRLSGTFGEGSSVSGA